QWTPREEVLAPSIPHASASLVVPQFVTLPAKSSEGGQPAPHMVLMPLLPEDRAFGYVPTITNAPARVSGIRSASIEEHFESGLSKWQGAIEDWMVDAAGVRAGSLALFTPTIDRRDYEMEFLARMESRSVTWVFRAANLNDYYRAGIAITPEGGYEFQRGSVIHGVSESVPATRIDMALNRRNAITIRLRAAGNEFTVWLNGQAIDSWSDSRLPAGGIGFIGAADDRARIYWVRLSSMGSQG